MGEAKMTRPQLPDFWLMERLTAVSDELYERYLKVSDRITGDDLASLSELSEGDLAGLSEPGLPKERLQ
jgi:hypothetical protein